MKDHYDPWFIRLPDGRVVNAKSTASVRHHVESGNIPLNSMARRNSNEEWVSLAWIEEFADLAGGGRNVATKEEPKPPTPAPSTNGSSPDISMKSGISSRLDPMRLQTVGIRGLVDELIAAFDSTVSTGKLVAACAIGGLGALGVFLVTRLTLLAFSDGVWLAQILAGCASLFVLAVIVGLLTRQTHLEVSTMRPVYFTEASKGIGAYVLRVFLGYAITIGVGAGLIMLLQHLPEWLMRLTSGTSATLTEGVLTLSMTAGTIAAVGIFALMLLSFLVPPVLVVEECSLGDAIREWRSILREHRVRVMVYEGMALALAMIAALPIAVPVFLAQTYGPGFAPNWIGHSVMPLLWGIAAGPALAFLAVANLFIYLNLRYEYTPGK